MHIVSLFNRFMSKIFKISFEWHTICVIHPHLLGFYVTYEMCAEHYIQKTRIPKLLEHTIIILIYFSVGMCI